MAFPVIRHYESRSIACFDSSMFWLSNHSQTDINQSSSFKASERQLMMSHLRERYQTVARVTLVGAVVQPSLT